MAWKDPTLRALQARAAAHTRWGNTTDRASGTAAAREAAESRFLRQVREEHPDLDDRTARELAESRRRAHFVKLAIASAAARKARREAHRARSRARGLDAQADTIEAELAEQIGADGGAL